MEVGRLVEEAEIAAAAAASVVGVATGFMLQLVPMAIVRVERGLLWQRSRHRWRGWFGSRPLRDVSLRGGLLAQCRRRPVCRIVDLGWPGGSGGCVGV